MGKASLLFVAATFIAAVYLLQGQQHTALQTDQKQSEYQQQLLARKSAEAGLGLAASWAKRDFDTWREGYSAIPYEGGTFDVALEGTAAGPIAITAQGRFSGAEHRARATLARLAPTPSALIVDADSVEVSFVGDDFLITGQDTRPRSALSTRREGNGSGTYADGVWTRTTQANNAFYAAAQGNRAQLVRGSQPQASIVRQDTEAMEEFPIHVGTLYSQARSLADETFAGGSVLANRQFGAPSDPQIVAVEGPAVFSGTTRGYGLLIVEGSLSAGDDFQWEGLVLARSEEEEMDVVLSNNATVYGALIARHGYSPAPESDPPPEEECTPEFIIDGNEVVVQEPFRLNIQVLGAAISYGGAYDMPVTAQILIDDQAYEPWGDYGKPLDANLNTGSTYAFSPDADLPAGTRIRINARSWYHRWGSGDQNYHWRVYMEKDSRYVNHQLAVLRDGSSVPEVGGYLGQASVQDFVAEYIDTEAGVMTMDDGEAINLFELGTTNTSSAAHDMQDLVVLLGLSSATSTSGGPGSESCTVASGGEGGGVPAPEGRLRFQMTNSASVFYSTEAIGKLAARLGEVKDASWIVEFDHVGEDLLSAEQVDGE